MGDDLISMRVLAAFGSAQDRERVADQALHQAAAAEPRPGRRRFRHHTRKLDCTQISLRDLRKLGCCGVMDGYWRARASENSPLRMRKARPSARWAAASSP